jgi:hypothetical protein
LHSSPNSSQSQRNLKGKQKDEPPASNSLLPHADTSNFQAYIQAGAQSLSQSVTPQKPSRESSRGFPSVSTHGSERASEPRLEHSNYGSPTPSTYQDSQQPVIPRNSLATGDSRVLTYGVPLRVRHVVFSRSCRSVAFLAGDVAMLYILNNNRSGYEIKARERTSLMHASLTDRNILIRAQQDAGGIHELVSAMNASHCNH